MKPADVTTLAWMGWSLRMPKDWRPIHVIGGWDRGTLVAGDAGSVRLQIKWLRPGPEGVDAERWIARRLRRQRRGTTPEPRPPRPADFATSAWALGPAGRTGDAIVLWCGWAPAAGLLVEVAMPGRAGSEPTRPLGELLASLCAVPAGAVVRTSVLGRSFEAPAGFRLVQWTLRLGDVCLRFEAKQGGRLTVRQVYPARLALTRRTLERWLEASAHADPHRRLSAESPQSLELAGSRGVLRGLRRNGWKRLRFPFGRVAAWNSVAAAVCDSENDRLLVAEYDARGAASESIVRTALVAMGYEETGDGGTATEGRCEGPESLKPAPEDGGRRGQAGRLSRDQALGATPVPVPVIRSEPAADGGLRLWLAATPPRWRSWLRFGRGNGGGESPGVRAVELDCMGREVYGACDGTVTVRDIVGRFSRAHRLGPAEAELAVTRFMQLLVRRGVIAMRIDRARAEVTGVP